MFSHVLRGSEVAPARSTLLAGTLLITYVLALACSPKDELVKDQPTDEAKFFCSETSGVPATIGTTESGKIVSVIRWTSKTFDAVGWTQKKRCEAVSERFELYREQGRLKYLTTGRMNGQPVICTTDKDGGACDGLVYTLKPDQDPTQTLKDLLEVKTLKRGPLNETTPRLYIKMSDVMNTADKNYSASPTGIGKSPLSSEETLW